jgi:hypothetical protein
MHGGIYSNTPCKVLPWCSWEKTYCVISTNFANILEKKYMKNFGKKKTWWGLSLNPTIKAMVYFWFFYKRKEMQCNSTFLYFLVAFYM